MWCSHHGMRSIRVICGRSAISHGLHQHQHQIDAASHALKAKLLALSLVDLFRICSGDIRISALAIIR